MSQKRLIVENVLIHKRHGLEFVLRLGFLKQLLMGRKRLILNNFVERRRVVELKALIARIWGLLGPPSVVLGSSYRDS